MATYIDDQFFRHGSPILSLICLFYAHLNGSSKQVTFYYQSAGQYDDFIHRNLLRSYPDFYKTFVNPAKVRYALNIDFSEMKPAASGCASFQMVDLFGIKY